MNKKRLVAALTKLGNDFDVMNWERTKENGFLVQKWPGGADEEIMVCVFKGTDVREPFHRQDFFFLNFAWQGDYGAISEKYDNHITVAENECYIGRPNAGYAIYGHSEEEIVIIGVLIRMDSFLKNFFSIFAGDTDMFRFFLEEKTETYAAEFIHLTFSKDDMIRSLLEWMVLEYAEPKDDTRQALRPMTVSLLTEIARQVKKEKAAAAPQTLSDRIVRYIAEHYDHVTLADIAAHFSYHPNYISTVLTKETGRSFSAIVLAQRMERARLLLRNTHLTVAEISALLGYTNTSNFHKAFRAYFGTSPGLARK